MVTGDNLADGGRHCCRGRVDDYLAEARPGRQALQLIRFCTRRRPPGGHDGDGTNDAPALAPGPMWPWPANSGTQAAKEAGNMVDLDSNPPVDRGGGNRQADAG